MNYPGATDLKRFLGLVAIIIPLAITGNIVYILLSTQQAVIGQLLQINWGYLALAILLAFIPWFTHSARTLLWANRLGRNIKPIQAFKVAIATEIGSAVTPTSTGGGYIKLGLLSLYGLNGGEATLITLLGSIEDAIFFIIAIPLAAFISSAWANQGLRAAIESLISHWPWIIVFAGVILILYLILFRWRSTLSFKKPDEESIKPSLLSRIRGKIGKFKREFQIASRFVATKGKGTLAACVLISGLGWCCRYGAISALALGLGLDVDPILFFLLQWVVFTAMAVIPTPGAIGGAEISFAAIYIGIFPAAVMPVIIGAWRFVTFYLLVMAGGIFLAIAGPGFAGRDAGHQDIKIIEEIKA